MTPQSGTAELTTVLTQLRYGAPQDYILIDLGSESSRRWLTSRLYILCLLLTLIDRPQCLVFVEDLVSVRHRFVGVADSGQVRWALARSYRWLEAAGTGAYAVSLGGLQGPVQQGLLLLSTDAIPPIDPITGSLNDYQVSQLLQQFLALIRLASGVVPPDPDKWVLLGNQSYEHARWLDGPRIERVLGGNLETSYITLPPNNSLTAVELPVIQQHQRRFVSVVDPDKTFRGLIDRSLILESLAAEFVKESTLR